MKSLLSVLVLIVVGCTGADDNAAPETITEPLITKSDSKGQAEGNVPSSNEQCIKAFEETIASLEAKAGFQPYADFFDQHSGCMDGSISAGLEAAISKSLDENWSKLDQLEVLFNDPGFKDFFLKNIGVYVSASEKNLEAVVSKPADECAAKDPAFCILIKSKAQAALDYAKTH